MEVSLFLAKLLGLYLLIIGLIWAFRKDLINSAFTDIVSSPGLLAIAGVWALLFGLAILISHPVYEFSWRLVITIIGYLAILKGILRLAYPAHEQKMAKAVLESRNYWAILAIVLVLGAFLTAHGFNIIKP